MSVRRRAGAEKPQSTVLVMPGQELGNRSLVKLEAVHKQSVACSHHNSQTPEYALGELKKREN